MCHGRYDVFFPNLGDRSVPGCLILFRQSRLNPTGLKFVVSMFCPCLVLDVLGHRPKRIAEVAQGLDWAQLVL